MPVYVIASYDITDPDGHESYLSSVVPLLEKHGAEVLVADHEAPEFGRRGTRAEPQLPPWPLSRFSMNTLFGSSR